MSASVQQAFIQKYGPTAQQVGQQTGLSPDFILGVAGLESGWGQHYINNNLFGIGNTTGSNGAVYSSPADSFSAFGNLITTDPRYAKVLAAGGDPQAEATALGQTPYNPAGAAYGNTVAQTTAQVSSLTGGLPGNGSAGVPTLTPTPTQPGSASAGGGGYIARNLITPVWELIQRSLIIIIGAAIVLIALAAMLFHSKTVEVPLKHLAVDAAA